MLFGLIVAQMAVKRERVEAKVREHREQLRLMASRLSLSEEDQRRRIATELHDSVSQDLALSLLKLESLENSLPSEALRADHQDIRDLLRKAMQDVRSITFDLTWPSLYRFGFEKAIEEWLIHQIGKIHGIEVAFASDGQMGPLEEETSVFLFQITRELLINVVKHAKAQHVSVSLCRMAESVQVTVADDGIGFDVSQAGTSVDENSGFGLFSLRERLTYLGGSMDIVTRTGQGTTVQLTAPIESKTTCGDLDERQNCTRGRSRIDA
jgi:signal transduction histidine kinase